MIHEISPHVFNNSYDPGAELKDDSFCFAFEGGNEPAFGAGAVLVKDGHITRYRDVREHLKGDPIPLFKLDDINCFLASGISDGIAENDGLMAFRKFRDIRQVQDIPKYEYFLAMTAFQLHNWYINNKFCGRCGGRLKPSEKERALVCPDCTHTVYPRIVPAVTVAIIDRERDRIVLTEYAGRDIPFFALVAGFTEIGETLEETVVREVREETGLKVKNIRYFGSQPWGIVDDLMVGFYCDLDGEAKIVRDESELQLADWFSREEVVLQPTDMSLTNSLMKAFKEGRI